MNFEPPFEFCCQTRRAKSLEFTLLLCENRVILISVVHLVLSQYTCVTEDRQTDDRHHIMTTAGHCNEIATFG